MNQKYVGLLFVGVLSGIGLLGLTCTEIITPGYAGVVTLFGSVRSEPMTEGLNFKTPFAGVEEWCIQVQKLHTGASAGSKDLQVVNTSISVNYRLQADKTPEIKRQLSASYEETVMTPALLETVKAVIAEYQAADLLAKRAEVRHKMEALLQEKLNIHLDGAIVVSALNVEDFTFEASFNHAIEAKQVAEQEAQRARNEVEREKAEADKKIEQARGRAQSRLLEAQAEADSIKIEAAARAQAITIEAQALQGNPAILKLRAIEKWNGAMPQVAGVGSGNVLLGIDLSGEKQ